MTKQEILNLIAQKFTFIHSVEPAPNGHRESMDGQHTTDWYVANVYDHGQGRHLNVQFVVLDEGMPAEDAVWFGANEPKPILQPTFTVEVTAWLQDRVADGTILHFGGLSADDLNERAVASIIRDEAGDVIERRVAIWQDTQGDFQYKQVQTV